MKIAVISDLDMKGSGYFGIITPLCDGLTEKGHEIKVAGLGYRGEEHNYNFSIIPASNMKECVTIVQNLSNPAVWGFDVLIVGLDIPHHKKLLEGFQTRNFKYLGIFPVEADPLDLDWAMSLMQMDKGFCISEFGTQEVIKRNIDMEHLVVGVSENWIPPQDDQREKIRQAFGIPEDAFVVLTVADNQERKNLQSSMKAYARFAEKVPNSRHVIVSRLGFIGGWNLETFGTELGIRDKLILMERGMPFLELWSLYAMSDVFLLLSKAEGMCFPALEAMSVGIPVVGTNCTAYVEHLKDNRGFLVDYLINEEYGLPYIDPFGNANRYFASVFQASDILLGIQSGELVHDQEAAWEYVRSRKWENAVEQVDKAIGELDGKKTKEN